MHAGLGASMFFLEEENLSMKTKYNAYVVQELFNIADFSNDTVKWEDTFTQWEIGQGGENSKRYNLGLAHGIPSILYFLTRFSDEQIDVKKTYRLLSGSLKYLLSSRIDPSRYGSHFSYYNKLGDTITGSRLGWCYGDLGVASTIWQYSNKFSSDSFKKIAYEIINHSSLRRDPTQCGIKDAGLCHGTMGIAHMFNRFYQETGEAKFSSAAIYWLKATTEFYRKNKEDVSFLSWDGYNWKMDYSLLTGISGVGLALLCALDGINPTWDRCLLLS